MILTEYEKRVLAATPGKALTFLRTAATKVEIRAALFAVGYSTAAQQEGWRLLHLASGYVPGVRSESDDAKARGAIAEIDAWDEPGFRRIKAALLRLHPEQHEFVFAGLEAARGAGSVLSVSTLLDRLDQLETGPEREATRAADRAALETLAARGIDSAERQHLRQLVQVAQTAEPPEFPSHPAVEQREQALLDLRAWYKDWSETARAVIQRKDYLIMLGLSKRRSSRSDDSDVVDAVDVDVDDDDVVEVDDAETPAPDSVGTPNDNEAAAQDSQTTAAVGDIAVSPNSGSSTGPETPAS